MSKMQDPNRCEDCGHQEDFCTCNLRRLRIERQEKFEKIVGRILDSQVSDIQQVTDTVLARNGLPCK